MKYLLLIMILSSSSLTSQVIFQFNKQANIENWKTVDDVVMGGKSSGSFYVNPEGYGTFQGYVSLENNGGFSSVRYRSGKIELKKHKKISIKLKGDGKKYQFRIKTNEGDYFSYITTFSTSGEWEEIEISLKDMYPTCRGRKLDKANFSDDSFEEIRFLIGNKKKESYKLLIDRIELK